MAEKSEQSRFGYQAGWIGAAGTHTVLNLLPLRKEVSIYAAQCRQLIKELKPTATLLERDAMRHTFVSARMAEKYGFEYSIFLGYAVESARDVVYKNPPQDRAMDLANNSIGATCGCENKGLDDETLFTRLWEKLERGALITSHDDQRLQDVTYLNDNHVAGPFFNRLRKISDTVYTFFPKPRSAAESIEHQRQVRSGIALEKE